ncbi:nifU-like N terminal domain protein, partial [Chlamydia psittaci 06-1683]
MTIPFQPV